MLECIERQEGLVALSGEATLRHVSELHSALASALGRGRGPLCVDLQGLTALDTAGVQVLVALKRTHPRVTVTNLSEGARMLIDRLGLLQVLTEDPPDQNHHEPSG